MQCSNFLFCPNSVFNTTKSHKISDGKALYFGSYQSKTSRRGGGGGGVGCDNASTRLKLEILDCSVFILLNGI